MKTTTFAFLTLCALSSLSSAQTAPPADDMILVRPTEKARDAIVDSIKAYAEGKKWVFMGANTLKPPQGEITFVKVCIPEVFKLIAPLGLKHIAMLPCGNFGIYQNQGKTEVSMLHPRYMHVLVPNPEIEKASALATPLLIDMLDAAAK